MPRTTLMMPGVAAVIGIAASLAAPANAHTQRYDTTITIRQKNDFTYVGRVSSERERCEKQREVRLYTAQGDFIGTSETDSKGRWRFEFVGKRYYATAPKRIDGSGDHRHVCKFDRSPTTE